MTEANNNAGAALQFIRESIKGNMIQAEGAGLDTLRAFRFIGDSLGEAKDILGKGDFGKWAEAEFGFSKEWRARLMRLAKLWEGVEAAMLWAQGEGRILGRKEYSVDGALALLAEWAREQPEAARALGAAFAEIADKEAEKAEKKAARQAEAEGDEGEGGEAGEGESEAERLRKALAEALAEIAKLRAEVQNLKAGAAQGEAPKGEAPEVDAKLKARARKVRTLAEKGATEGERDAAKARLAEMAKGAGFANVADFLTAAGLEPI